MQTVMRCNDLQTINMQHLVALFSCLNRCASDAIPNTNSECQNATPETCTISDSD